MSDFPTRTNRTGYYLPTDPDGNSKGYLRHSHALKNNPQSYLWHPASEVHTSDTDAHTRYDSWTFSKTVWAVSNKDISDFDKAVLIAQAKEYHDARRS
jgi:hypothetical protein